MATATVSPPTTEIGAASSHGTLSWGHYVDDKERVPELRWPRSVIEYDKIRNDSQAAALQAGTDLPIRGFKWMVDPNGAEPDVYERLAEDLALPIKGITDEVDETATNFDHDEHLRHALLARVYGHMFFEQVGRIDDEGWFRYTKLAPRMPLTLMDIGVDKDGGLKSITQNIQREAGAPPKPIPVDRLVAFVWDREGGNWAGRSAFRPLYPNFLLKSRLMRVDATKHERNGMGVPVARATQESVGRRALATASKLAQKLRVGQNAGAALPWGVDVDLKGVQGNLPDTLASIKYHDEAMARALLMMFLQLGQTESGSRALGSEFIDFFALSLHAIAKWYARIMTKHVCRDWVVWNVGEGARTPKIVWEAPPKELLVADFTALLDAGAITLDPELEGWVRGRWGMPAKVQEAIKAARPVGQRVRASEDPGIPLPARALRRQPYAHEVTAAVDFAAMDADFESAVETLVSEWEGVRDGHINEIVDIIASIDSDDLAALSAVEATSGLGQDAIAEVMHTLADKGAAAAVAEAKAQGVTDAAVPELADVKASLTLRAEAVDTLLTRSLSEAAARKAVSLGGAALAADDIANEVRTYLTGLSNTYLEEQFSGVVAQSMNTGRRKVLLEQEPETIYASELLDKNTCESCKAKDGAEYDSVTAAEADYPSGGYKDCKGGPKCRGTLVGVYE